MCGICGLVGLEDGQLLKRMCDVIEHRGPNDSGFYTNGKVSLGNRRLSIIDVKGGHQPIHNEDETIWVTFNGEIYNYGQLKQGLEKSGHKFYTNSDTEAIVHLYEKYGEKFVEKLRGMFAIAIWDDKKKRLVLTRDRLGKKPLYYSVVNGIFLFGSEIKSILQYEETPRKVDFKALDYFLTFRYVPGPLTMFQGIKKLQPGHTLIYENGKIRIQKYWDVAFSSEQENENYFSKKLLGLLRESVKIRLMSEVPLGAYLSGGTDSSSIVKIMSEFMEDPIKTFTVGFGDPRFDELKYAKMISEEFGTDHHEFIVNPNDVNILPKVIWHFDEPIADPAALPTFMLSELAKKYVTVVLTGEGGDELFAGYEQYKIILKTEQYLGPMPKVVKTKLIPKIIKAVPKKFLNLFFAYSSSFGKKGMERFSEYMSSFGDLGKKYLSIVSIFDEKEKRNILQKQFLSTNSLKLVNNYLRSVNAKTLNKLLLLETKVQLPDNLLMKVDKMTMAYSIEARAPLLDQELVEFSASIPPQLKLKGMTDKYILRKAMNDLIPKAIVKRKKQRFFVPIDIWFERDLGKIVKQIFSNQRECERMHLNSKFIQKIIQNHHESKLYYSRQLWSLLTFALWHKIFIDPDKITDSPPKFDKLFE